MLVGLERLVSVGFLPYYAKALEVKFSSDLNLRKETSEFTGYDISNWIRTARLEEAGWSVSPAQKHLNASDEAQASV